MHGARQDLPGQDLPGQDLPGVSGIAIYVPRLRVRLQDWCSWRGEPWPKVEAVVGRSFRVCAPHESVYTMAANAVLRLILQYHVDPQSVGFLGFGTESSTDNAAGTVIIKGMVDRALEEMGRPRLARSCEVPEFKQACLGGIYALKGALRYLSCDGLERTAIVVSADVAEYARGSSGEQTQGAGAVAFLLEPRPRLFELDVWRGGSSSDYRGVDFRKPMARHFIGDMPPVHGVCPRDFPVFNGRYSTVCYTDAVAHAMAALLARQRLRPREYFDRVAGIFFHRPYHRMPQQALATLLVWGLAVDPMEREGLERLCAEAGVSFEAIEQEVGFGPSFFEWAREQGVNRPPCPHLAALASHYRRTDEFQDFVRRKMTLGDQWTRDLGNLYTASLPAWLGAAFEEAHDRAQALESREFVCVGYGSGDAAEALPLHVVDGWREPAARIGFAEALADPVDLSQAQYEALHDGRPDPCLSDLPRSGFVIDRVGRATSPAFQDIGVEYYRWVP